MNSYKASITSWLYSMTLLKISNFAASMWFSISMDRMYTVQCTYDFASFKIENRLPKFLTVYTGRKTVILQSIFWVHIHTATSAPNTLVRADKESTEKGGGGQTPHSAYERGWNCKNSWLTWYLVIFLFIKLFLT